MNINEFIKDKLNFINYSVYCELNDVINNVKGNYVEIFVLDEQINSNSIKDYFTKDTIFNQSTDGYFIFINPCTLANWGHECFYLFLTKDTLLIEDKHWPPDNIQNMIKCKI